MDANSLSLKIQAEVVPLTLQVPKEKYDGTTDPIDHVAYFESTLDLYGMTNVIKCRVFLTTFKGMTQSWYDSLSSQSITIFKLFKRIFLRHFIANKR